MSEFILTINQLFIFNFKGFLKTICLFLIVLLQLIQIRNCDEINEDKISLDNSHNRDRITKYDFDLTNSKNRMLGLNTPFDDQSIYSAFTLGSSSRLDVLNKGKRIYVTNQLNEYNVDTNSNVNINLSNLNSQIGTDIYRVVSMFHQKKSISDGDDYFVRYILSPNIIYSYIYQQEDPKTKKYDDFKANCNYTSTDISYNIHTVSNIKGKKFFKLRVLNFVLDEERRGIFVATYSNGTFTYVDFDRYIDLENISSSYVNSESIKNQTTNANANINTNTNTNTNTNNNKTNTNNSTNSTATNSTTQQNNRYLQSNSLNSSNSSNSTDDQPYIPNFEKFSKNYINLNSIPRTTGIKFDNIFIFDHPYDKYTYIGFYRKEQSALLIYELVTDSKGGLVSALFYAEIYLKLYLTEPITHLITDHEEQMEKIMKFKERIKTDTSNIQSSTVSSTTNTNTSNNFNISNNTTNANNSNISNNTTNTTNSNSTTSIRLLQNNSSDVAVMVKNSTISENNNSSKVFNDANGYDVTQLGIYKGNMIIGTDQGLFILSQTSDKTPNSFRLIRTLTRISYINDNKLYNLRVLNFVVGNYYMYILVKYFGIVQLELSTMGISNKFQYFHPYVKQMDFTINAITFTKFLGVSFQNTNEMNDLLFEINIDDEEQPLINKMYTKYEPIISNNFVTNDFFYTYIFDKSSKKIYMLRRAMINNIPHVINSIDVSSIVNNLSDLELVSIFNQSSDINELAFVVDNFMIFINRIVFPPDRMICRFNEPGYYNVTLEKFSEACDDSINFNYAYAYCQSLIYVNFNVIGKSFSNVAIAFTVIGIIALIGLIILLIILYMKNQFNSQKVKKKEPTREELYIDKFADIDRKDVIIKEDDDDEEKKQKDFEKEKKEIEQSNRIVINNVLKGNKINKNLDDI